MRFKHLGYILGVAFLSGFVAMCSLGPPVMAQGTGGLGPTGPSAAGIAGINGSVASGSAVDVACYLTTGKQLGDCNSSVGNIGGLNVTGSTPPANGFYSGVASRVDVSTALTDRAAWTTTAYTSVTAGGFRLPYTAANCTTAPSLIPSSSAAAYGVSGDGSTKVCVVINGVDLADFTSGGLSVAGTITGTSIISTAGFNNFTSNTYSLTGSAANSLFNAAGTLNTSGSPDVFKLAITDTAHGGSTKLFNLYGGASGTTSEFSVDMTGNGLFAQGVTAGLSVQAGGGASILWNGRSRILSPVDGVIELANNATTDFSRLQFGGTTSSFPAEKRSGTTIQVRLADDSADAPMSMSGLTLSALSTGTNADFLCLSAGGVVLLQTSACTISSIRFKEEIKPFGASALAGIKNLNVFTYRLKATKPANKDPNARSLQLGLTAENVAKVIPLCAIYENDMRTPKSYRQECVIAYLVKGEQELMAANANLAKRVANLERRK